jgi:IS30 family transposase
VSHKPAGRTGFWHFGFETVKWDFSDKEFAEHEKLGARLGAVVYFAKPYHSWERGLNENTNGLLRQYFPKGIDLQ